MKCHFSGGLADANLLSARLHERFVVPEETRDLLEGRLVRALRDGCREELLNEREQLRLGSGPICHRVVSPILEQLRRRSSRCR